MMCIIKGYNQRVALVMFIMNRRRMVGMMVMVMLVVIAVGQELGVEAGKVENGTVGEAETVGSEAVIAEDQGSQLKQDEDVKKAEDTNLGEAAPVQKQAETVQIKTEEKPAEATQNSLQPETTNTKTPEVQPAPTAEPSITVNPQPQPIPTPESQPQNPPHTHDDTLANLTSQQQAKLLHEQSIRAQLHANQDLNLATLANLTSQQQVAMEKKLAEQAKIAYQRAAKEKEERETRERQELEQMLKQEQLSKSKQIILKEKLKVKKLISSLPNVFSYDQFMFDMDPYMQQDFMISLPIAQNVGFAVSVYSNQDGVYIRPQEIDESNPINIKVFENNNRIIYDENFYIQNAHNFQGREATYTFKFTNTDTHRLIAFKVTHVLQRKHLDNTITLNDVHSHAERARVLYNSMKNRFLGLDSITTLENSNRRRLTGEIKSYYIYTLVEMVIFVGVVLVQIELIRKLLGNASIV